jgi:outer membrane protein assembly factor BamD
MSHKIAKLFIISLMMAVFFSCSNRGLKKQEMGPNEYFEYAKTKFDKGDYLDAITEFTVITLRFSNDPVVDDAQYYLAESHFKQKEFLIAVSEFQKLINDYPQSAYAILAQFKVGLSYYNMSLRPELDQEYTLKAIREFQTFIEEHPDHELAAECDKLIRKLRLKLARKLYNNATTYRKMGEHSAALVYYELFMERYYDTPLVPDVSFWRAEMLYKLERYEEALSQFTILVEKYPQHPKINLAKERISEISELLNSQKVDEANNN